MKTSFIAKATAVTAFAVIAATGFTAPSQFKVSAEETLPETETVKEQTIEAEAESTGNDREETYSVDVDPEDTESKFALVSVADGDVTRVVVNNFDGYKPDIDELAKNILGDEVSLEEASKSEFFYNDQKLREALSEEELAEYDEITGKIAELEKKLISTGDEDVSPSDDPDKDFEELNRLYDRLAKIVESAGIDTTVPVNELTVKTDPDSEETQCYTYFKIIDDSEVGKEYNKVSITTEV